MDLLEFSRVELLEDLVMEVVGIGMNDPAGFDINPGNDTAVATGIGLRVAAFEHVAGLSAAHFLF